MGLRASSGESRREYEHWSRIACTLRAPHRGIEVRAAVGIVTELAAVVGTKGHDRALPRSDDRVEVADGHIGDGGWAIAVPRNVEGRWSRAATNGSARVVL